MNTTDTAHRKGIIGTRESFWLYDSETGFDLTHPPEPHSEPLQPRYTIATNTLPITIHPPHSALVIIDMQNFFLSTALGRPSTSNGLKAQAQLLEHAIPAARKAGIRVIWLNWGLTDDDLATMPPATLRAFGFETVLASQFGKANGPGSKDAAIDSHGINEDAPSISKAKVETGGKNPRIYVSPPNLFDNTNQWRSTETIIAQVCRRMSLSVAAAAERLTRTPWIRRLANTPRSHKDLRRTPLCMC